MKLAGSDSSGKKPYGSKLEFKTLSACQKKKMLSLASKLYFWVPSRGRRASHLIIIVF
jgi:hypothetical protein